MVVTLDTDRAGNDTNCGAGDFGDRSKHITQEEYRAAETKPNDCQAGVEPLGNPGGGTGELFMKIVIADGGRAERVR